MVKARNPENVNAVTRGIGALLALDCDDEARARKYVDELTTEDAMELYTLAMQLVNVVYRTKLAPMTNGERFPAADELTAERFQKGKA